MVYVYVCVKKKKISGSIKVGNEYNLEKITLLSTKISNLTFKV